jgi:2-dehydro-3-deoxyphosphogluconate aldolase/(4S)-4-hydroxy-2-oxoglutarate aldolase
VVREESFAAASAVAEAYARNGIGIVEITMTTPDALDLIAAVVQRHGSEVTVIVSPHTDPRVIEYANENDLLCVAGAATATEIIRAWEMGCDIVKVYPALQLGGPDYIRTIRGPIRDVPMLAGGPVPLDTIEAYLDAGCMAVNLGPSLAVPDLVRTEQWEEIGRRAMLASSIIQSRRQGRESASWVH